MILQIQVFFLHGAIFSSSFWGQWQSLVPNLNKIETLYYWRKRIVGLWERGEKKYVRSGIRTHAGRTRLRPERSALDRSAILTDTIRFSIKTQPVFTIRHVLLSQRRPGNWKHRAATSPANSKNIAFSEEMWYICHRYHIRVGGVAVSMVAFQAIDPGSTPGRRKISFVFLEGSNIFWAWIFFHCPWFGPRN